MLCPVKSTTYLGVKLLKGQLLSNHTSNSCSDFKFRNGSLWVKARGGRGFQYIAWFPLPSKFHLQSIWKDETFAEERNVYLSLKTSNLCELGVGRMTSYMRHPLVLGSSREHRKIQNFYSLTNLQQLRSKINCWNVSQSAKLT